MIKKVLAMTKFMKLVHVSMFVALCAVFAPPIVMLFDRQVPFVSESGIMEPESPGEGDAFRVIWSGKRYRQCPGKVYREVTDAQGEVHRFAPVDVRYDPTLPNTPYGSPDMVFQNARMPNGMSTGALTPTYRAHIYWHCNWAQEYVWPIYSETPLLPFQLTYPN